METVWLAFDARRVRGEEHGQPPARGPPRLALPAGGGAPSQPKAEDSRGEGGAAVRRLGPAGEARGPASSA